MATISITSAPATSIEWKAFDVTVTVTRGGFDMWGAGTVYIFLKYGGVTVYSDSHDHTGSTSFSYTFGDINDNPVNARYQYSGATIETYFDPDIGGDTPTVPATINIDPAYRQFTGGPYGRTPVQGCRWTEEAITVTMRESSTGPVITTYGEIINPDEPVEYVDYGLSSDDGITFKDSVGGSAITSIQFSAGIATFAIAMDNENASAVFTFEDQETDWSADTYASDPINVVNPNFNWSNIFNASNESTAYDEVTTAEVSAANPITGGPSLSNLPSTNFNVVSDPDTAVDTPAGPLGFTGGTLSINPIIFQTVQSNVRLKLEYTPDPTFEAYSDYFDIISPSFVFSGGPFARSVPRFFDSETNNFTITAQNHLTIPTTVTNLPSNSWDITGLNPDLTGQTFTSGVANPTATFPTGAPGSYTLTVTRSTETSLTGSDTIDMAAQINLDTPLVSGSDVTISGTASYDGSGTIDVFIDLASGDAGATPTSDTVTTYDVNTGAFTRTFTSLGNGNYTVTVKEDEDPGTSTEATDTFNISVIPTELNVTFTDDLGGVEQVSHDLDSLLATDEPPLGTHANIELDVTITTSSPGTSDPAATLTKPDGTTYSLVFTGLNSKIDQTVMDINGIYEISVDDYIDGTSATTPGVIRRFLIAYSTTVLTQQIEGWGYYPREEGVVSNCAEEASGSITVPNWIESGGATVAASLTNPLTITTAGPASDKIFSRTYNYIFENLGEPAGTIGTGSGYIEAGVNVTVTTAGDIINAKDQDDNDTTFRSTGAGLILRNGPYQFALTMIDVQTGSYTGKRLAVKLYHPENEVYHISSAVVDWETTAYIIRIDKFKNMGDQVFEVTCKPQNSALAFGPTLISIPAYRLTGDTTLDLDTANVAFGVFENHNQDIESDWEFVRYAFFDEGFTLAGGETYRIGFEQTQRTGETDFYRSPMIEINGSAVDQPVVGTNQVVAVIFREAPIRFNGFNIPTKVRYSMADWDDSAEDSTDGFFKTGFVNYYETADEFGALNATRSCIAESLPTAGATSGNVAWDYALDDARLMRRLFIIGAVDAPLLPTPTVINGLTTSDYLIDDVTDKPDLRCAVRQFLPDFYIRDKETDDGSAPSGGSNSPDITLGIFLGDGSTYDPNDVPVDGWDTDAPRYPAGFARGETPVSGGSGSYWTYNDQKAGAGIKTVRDAWTDYDATNHYFNRVWLRISNRGIVPGPAKIQAFYGDSQVRSDFVPSNARDDNWEQILGKPTLATDEKYVQDVFVRFDPQITDSGDPDYQKYPTHRVEAIPALSGYSTPGTDKSYTLAEFKWRIALADMPPAGKAHGCITGFINQPDEFPEATTGVDNARRWDAGPLKGTADTTDPNVSIWPITREANNVTVKNSNIVLGEDPAAGGDDFNELLKTTIGNDDDPVNYRKSPVDYQLTFGKKQAKLGLRLDGKSFKEGELVLKINRAISKNVKLRNFKEITDYENKNKILLRALPDAIGFEEAIAIPPSKWLKKQPYRFFILKRGSVGTIDNLKPIYQTKKEVELIYNQCNIYFRPDSGIKEGAHTIKIEQLVNNVPIGGYVTEICIIGKDMVKFIGDERKMIAYKAKDHYYDKKVIPYEKRIPLIGAGMAHVENFRIDRKEIEKLKKPQDENEFANIDLAVAKEEEAEAVIDELVDIPYSVTGKVIDQDKKAVSNVIVRLYDQDENFDDFLGACKTDKDGYYTINYTEKDFRDNFGKDTRPDIYIVIVDKNGNELAKTKTIHNADTHLEKDIILKEKPAEEKKGFRVHGLILYKKKKPSNGILIRAYDEDKKTEDDFLGESWTDAEGNFEILFDEKAFMDRRNKEAEEGLPDVYLNIYKKEKSGLKLTGRTKTSYNIKEEESYLIKLEE